MKCKLGGILFIALIVAFLLMKAATDKQLKERAVVASRENGPLKCRPSIKAAVGGDVTLDFHFQPQRDVTGRSVEWKFNNVAYVLVYRSRGFAQNIQDQQFKGRATLDSSGKLTEGKLTLKISNVTTDDAGMYSCSVRGGEESIACSTELSIDTEKPEDGVKRVRSKAQNQRGPTFVLALAESMFLYLLSH